MARRLSPAALQAARAVAQAGGILTPAVARQVATRDPRAGKARTAPCPDCANKPFGSEKCETCGGSGIVTAPPADGEGNVLERAAAWRNVEEAQHDLNLAARECGVDFMTNAIAEYQEAVEDYARMGAGQWHVVRECQLNVNRRAAEVPDLVPLVRVLEARLAEYRRIGGAANRAPGVGMLS